MKTCLTWGRRAAWTRLLVGVVGTFLGVCGGPVAALSQAEWPRRVLGQSADGVPFVENAVCQQCHAQAYQDWRGSHHEQAMQAATDQTVLGDFDNAHFTHHGITSRFFKRDGTFFVHTQGADGQMGDYAIHYTFGVEPLQQYLIPYPGGRLQVLSIAWDTHRKRWFHLDANDTVTPGAPLHWTGLYQTWNVMCADCHSTNLHKNYDATTDSYQTTWSAINVSCQACHGAGGDHVAWARSQSTGTPSQPYSNKGLEVDFSAIEGRGQVEVCARCHSRHHRVSLANQPQRPLLEDVVPSVLRQGLYHADGQIHDEVYAYGSFLQSKMYRAGVRCTDCHNPHSLGLKATGNALCGQCHQPQPPARFPSLIPKAYDTPAHHFHPEGSAGAQCVNCHMPAQTYMVVDPRRDHSIRVPRPDLSVTLGTPNACTACHTGRTAQWAAETVTRWYGAKPARRAHYADVLAAGRAGQAEALPLLTQLAGTTAQPTMIRATALDLLRQYGPSGTTAMVAALHDADPLVRFTAVGGLDHLPPQARLPVVAPLLRDPTRAVRLEAARVLAAVPLDRFPAAARVAFDAALTDFIAMQRAMADMPGAHLNLAVLQTQQGQTALAVQSYQTALRLDPAFLPARFNLAQLYNQIQQKAKAEYVLRQALPYAPQEGELYYALGLLLAEAQRLEDAAEALGTAAKLLPTRARVQYNYGLILQHLGRHPEAESAFRLAYQLHPDDVDILHALTIFYAQQQHWDQAILYVEHLIRVAPHAPGPQRLREQIRQGQGQSSRP